MLHILTNIFTLSLPRKFIAIVDGHLICSVVPFTMPVNYIFYLKQYLFYLLYFLRTEEKFLTLRLQVL